MWAEWAEEQKEKGLFKARVQGEGMNSSWLEDENGNRVDRHRQQLVLGEARRTWFTMREFEIKLAPHGNMSIPTLDYFCAKMELSFLELKLCANHWKADKMWRENFSSWDSKYSSKEPQGTIRSSKEPQEDGDDVLQPEPLSEEEVSGL